MNRIVQSLLVSCLLFYAPGIWAAVTGKVSGKVTESATDKALPGANIIIEGTTLGAAANLDGDYFILNVPPGTYSIKASMIGYKQIIKTEIRVKIDQTTGVNFSLAEEAIVGETITVVSERPPVELDLTASKVTISGDEIVNSWMSNVDEVVTIQSGVNVHGGLRGGFGLDVNYIIDGQEIRDTGSNSSFIAVNTTTIQDMEVLTGGWNAEYPQANSGIVNIVTKSAQNKIHGNVEFRYRPPGKYHWGPKIYGDDRWENRETDWNGNPAPGSVEYWTTHDGGSEPFKSMTPEERLAYWQEGLRFASESGLADYDKRHQWDAEGTFTGPITQDIGFLVSGKYFRNAGALPSALEYSPTWNLQLKVDYDIADNTNLLISGMHWGTDNGGLSVTPYMSTEDAGFGASNPGGYFYSAYNPGKYWPWGGFAFGGGASLGRLKAPEYVRQHSIQAKVTHVYSPSTFLQVSAQHLRMKRHADFFDVDRGYYSFQENTGAFEFYNTHFMNNGIFRNFGEGSDVFYDQIRTRNTTLKADLTSQVHPAHQIRTGLSFSTQYYKKVFALGWSSTAFTTDYLEPDFKPWEASAYLQDKIEIEGMIVNAGLRLDMFNANRKVNYTIFDPFSISPMTLGHTREVGYIEFDPDGRFAESTPTRVAISPRVGISHPITDNTVLHFMYGHFNQRPGWMKLGANGDLQNNPRQAETIPPENRFPIETTVIKYNSNNIRFSNPRMDFERMIQYEVGFEQNIEDLLRFDLTMYYKDGKNLSTLGYFSGRPDTDFDFTTGLLTTLYPDPDDPVFGKTGAVVVPINGGFMDVRGLEADIETRFLRNANIKLVYNLSWMNVGTYGASRLYREFEDGTKAGIDRFFGGNNGDKGGGGNSNEQWNPSNTIKLIATLNIPKGFGPTVGSFHPLAEWYLNIYSEYASGQKFTYHSAIAGDLSTEPNNETWKARYQTNIRLARTVNLLSGLQTQLSLNVINLFNQKQLRLPGGQQLVDYMEEGKLPVHPTTGENLEWDWYELRVMPRQVFLGIGFEF